jgi:NADH-quinone oxidoreductase subunit H
MTAAAYLVLLERWIAAWIQDRIGPNRVGVPLTKIRLFGLGQPIADGGKIFFKSEVTPSRADRALFFAAPAVIFAAAIAVFAVIPFGSVLPPNLFPASWGIDEPIRLIAAPNLDVGMLYVFAVSGIAVYGVVLGGWASNTKYSFLGGLRSSAQLVSYELPLGLGILGVVLMSGSLRLDVIISSQAAAGVWNAFNQPLGFVVFCVAAFAEAARLPFDLPEAEQELVAGYHTEYSGIKMMLFMVAEFLHMVAAAFLIVILFLGGWHCWGLTGSDEASPLALRERVRVRAEAERVSPSEENNATTALTSGPSPNGRGDITWPIAILRVIVLLVKVMGVILFFMLARWSWPRFRYDQLMDVGWKVMIPWGMVNLAVVAVWAEFGDAIGPLVGVSPERGMIAFGWATLLLVWLVTSVLDPTRNGNRPQRGLPS